MFILFHFEPGLLGCQNIQVHGALLNTVPALIVLMWPQGNHDLFLIVSLSWSLLKKQILSFCLVIHVEMKYLLEATLTVKEAWNIRTTSSKNSALLWARCSPEAGWWQSQLLNFEIHCIEIFWCGSIQIRHREHSRTTKKQHSTILHAKTSPSFYLHSWLVDHGVGAGQLAWKGSWSSVPTQDQSLRWKNPQGARGRAVGPLEPCPRAWVPETARAPSHLDSNG